MGFPFSYKIPRPNIALLRGRSEDLDLVRCVGLLVLLAEDVDVPLRVRLCAVAERHVEAEVVILAEGADGVVLLLRNLNLLEVRLDAC